MPDLLCGKRQNSPGDQQRDKEHVGVPMGDVLVVNQMTWPELARQCIVANVRRGVRVGGGGGGGKKKEMRWGIEEREAATVVFFSGGTWIFLVVWKRGERALPTGHREECVVSSGIVWSSLSPPTTHQIKNQKGE